MNEIEKEIEEMAKKIDKTFSYAKMYYPDKYEPFEVNVYPDEIAKYLVEQGYRNCKDKVVLDKEEYQNDFSSQFNKGYEKGSKETAREIFNKLYNYLPPREKANVEIKKSSLEDVEKVTLQMYKCLKDDVRELAKEYGVEVE